MIRLPVPRRLPSAVRLFGGSQVKVLARQHAQAVVDAVTDEPALVEFWRRSWVHDETFVGSVLNTPRLVPGWDSEHVSADLWFIAWQEGRSKSPPWLGTREFAALSAAARPDTGVPRLFARKFSTGTDPEVLNMIDQDLGRTPDYSR
jgi:hypothetical protein